MIISFLPCGVCGKLTLIGKLTKLEDVDYFLCADCLNEMNNEKQGETSIEENKTNENQNIDN